MWRALQPAKSLPDGPAGKLCFSDISPNNSNFRVKLLCHLSSSPPRRCCAKTSAHCWQRPPQGWLQPLPQQLSVGHRPSARTAPCLVVAGGEWKERLADFSLNCGNKCSQATQIPTPSLLHHHGFVCMSSADTSKYFISVPQDNLPSSALFPQTAQWNSKFISIHNI